MPIKDIRTFVDYCGIGDSTIDNRLDIIRDQRDSVLKQMADLKSNLDMLDYKVFYYETAKEAGSCSYVDNLSKEDIPKKFRKYI